MVGLPDPGPVRAVSEGMGMSCRQDQDHLLCHFGVDPEILRAFLVFLLPFCTTLFALYNGDDLCQGV